MKHIKNVLATTLAVCALASTTSAFAANVTDNELPASLSFTTEARQNFAMVPNELKEKIMSNPNLQEAASLAYMDIDKAPRSLESKILQARRQIIFSESWTVNGSTYTVRADGTVEYDPEFSYLFPGWDIPRDDDTNDVSPATTQSLRASSTEVTNFKIPKVTNGDNAKSMIDVRATTSELVFTRIMSLSIASCNIGNSHAVLSWF